MDRLGPNDRIERDSWNREVGKQVDLVIYKGGQRIVIGRASIEPDGKIEAQIAKDVRADVKAIFDGAIGDLSINPPLHIPYDKMVLKTEDFTTKIQET